MAFLPYVAAMQSSTHSTRYINLHGIDTKFDVVHVIIDILRFEDILTISILKLEKAYMYVYKVYYMLQFSFVFSRERMNRFERFNDHTIYNGKVILLFDNSVINSYPILIFVTFVNTQLSLYSIENKLLLFIKKLGNFIFIM